MKTLLPALILCALAVACGVDESDPLGPERTEPDAAADVADTTSDIVAPDAADLGEADVDAAEPDAPAPDADAATEDVPESDAPDAGDAVDAPDAELDAEGDIADADAEPDVPLVPPEDCIGATPEMDHGEPSAGDPHECPTCLGEAAPDWVLYDFQPLSCGAGSHYGMDQFQGRPTMLVLLSAGCSYCLGQTVKLEELWWELTGAGHEFHFVVVNLATMADRRDNLTDRAGFPMFQDTEDLDIWGVQGGGKDDFYFYDEEGILRAYYPARGTVETYLSEDEGYGNVRDAMLYLLGEDVALPGDGDGTLPDEGGE